MTKEELDDLKPIIQEAVSTAVKDRFKIILTKLDNIQGTMDTAFKQLDDDRKDFAEVRTNQSTIDQRTKEILDVVTHITPRIGQKVEEKAAETIDAAAQKVAEQVEPAMNHVLRKVKKGLPLDGSRWWQFWKRW